MADLTAKGIERRESERKLRAGNLSLRELSETMVEENSLDLNGLIQEVLALIARELSENRILLGRELTKTFPYVLGDRLQLQQVLLNLFINGIEAMAAVTDRPRVLSVQSWVDESRNALVIVRDSGTGLDVEAAMQGRGLGLTSMQERVRLVNGVITIDSKPMRGTTIHARVPLESEYDSHRAAG